MTTTVKTTTNLKQIKDALLANTKYEHLVAGISGGVAATMILHPLDVIKIRFAVNDGRNTGTPKYNGIMDAFRTVLRQEGVRGLYRGVVANIWGAGSSWGLYFLFYNTIKATMQEGNLQTAIGAGNHLLAASEAGALTLLFTNPIWVVKTRLCLQFCDKGSQQYGGMLDALKKIYISEGLRGYYRGFIPGLFGVSHGAIQFMTYEELKNKYNQYKSRPITTKLSSLEYLTFAAASKLVAASVTYPYQVVRARLQDQRRFYGGVFGCVRDTWVYEGWRGFYKGLGPNLVRVTPATMITFLVYENVTHSLLRRNVTNEL